MPSMMCAASSIHIGIFRREVTQAWRFPGDFHPLESLTVCEYLEDDFKDVVHMTLGVDPTGNGQPYQIHGGGQL